MSTSITLPQLGESVAEGTIGKWFKAAGERIERDEPLVEIITDKVTAEMPSPVAGVLERIAVQEGETVPVGTEIAVVGSGERVSVDASPASASVDVLPSAHDGPGEPQQPAIRTPPQPASRPAVAEPETQRASPLVRRLAQEHGVNVGDVSGTGTGGRVTKDDMLAFIKARQQAPATQQVTARPAQPSAAPALSDGDEVVPLSTMRRAIAEHMVRSMQTIPHAWTLVEVDVTPVVRWREQIVADWQRQEGFELTYLPFFIKAVVEALHEHPMMNSAWSDQGIVLRRRLNVGIAVALEEGLIVPVLHDADQMSIAGLARASRQLIGRARSGHLTPDDVQGGTFTVNNTGALGSIMSAPIIPQGQAGILTMEAIVPRPVVRDDAIAIRLLTNCCLSFDHRILDGAQALRFIQGVRRRLEGFGPSTTLY